MASWRPGSWPLDITNIFTSRTRNGTLHLQNGLGPVKTKFHRADGVVIRIVPGFRDRVLGARPSGTPQEHWTDAEYEAAARRRLEDARRRERDLLRFAPPGGLHHG